MNYLSSTGQYLTLLKELLEREVGDKSDKETKAEIIFPSAIEDIAPTHPQVIVDNVEIDKVSRANDGRKQYELDVSFFVRVPTNLGDAEVIALTLAGYLTALMEFQRFGFDDKTISNPVEIGADPTPWNNGEAGYQINFAQTIRVGEAIIDPFAAVEAKINKVHRDGVIENVESMALNK